MLLDEVDLDPNQIESWYPDTVYVFFRVPCVCSVDSVQDLRRSYYKL